MLGSTIHSEIFTNDKTDKKASELEVISKEITQNKAEKEKKMENIEDRCKDTSHSTLMNQKTGEGVWKFVLSLQQILMYTRVCKPLVNFKKKR